MDIVIDKIFNDIVKFKYKKINISVNVSKKYFIISKNI